MYKSNVSRSVLPYVNSIYLCQLALGNKFCEKICLTVLTNLFSRDAYFELLPKLKLALYGSGNLVPSKSSYGRLWPHLSNTRFNSKLKLRIFNVLLLAPRTSFNSTCKCWTFHYILFHLATFTK